MYYNVFIVCCVYVCYIYVYMLYVYIHVYVCMLLCVYHKYLLKNQRSLRFFFGEILISTKKLFFSCGLLLKFSCK